VQVNLKDDVLLAKVVGDSTAWVIVPWKGNKKIKEKLWVWHREVHVNLKNNF